MANIKPPHFKSKEELLGYAKRIEGKRISEISNSVARLDNLPRNILKNQVADIIEQGYFNLPKSSAEHADFKELGIELKVSPLKYILTVNLINAKERNVIGMVDYFDIAQTPNWRENKKLSCKATNVLFVLYLHDNTKPAMQWRVLLTFLWTPNEHDSNLIQKDYDAMRNKVINGERLREGDNYFFATCPKHGGGYNRKKPYLSKKASLCAHPTIKHAEKRGFCIKQTKFTELIARYGLGVNVVRRRNSTGINPLAFHSLRKNNYI